MWETILQTFIQMIVDGLEDFFSVMVYPNKKYLRTSIFISFGFLVFSLICLVFDIMVFVTYQEALAGLAMLVIIYVASVTTMGDINKVKSVVKSRAVSIINETKSKGKGSKKKVVKKGAKK